MKSSKTYDITITEEQAKALCEKIRQTQSAYMNKHYPPCYTAQTSANGAETYFVVWYRV